MDIFRTDGAAISYELSAADSSPAGTFVQLHGLTSCGSREHRVGLDMTGRLESMRVLRYDARGHGGSTGRKVAEDYRWPRLAGDLLALLDALAPGEQVHAAGPSMGAATLLHAALSAPRRFATLTLLVPPTAWETRAAQAGNYRRSAQLVEDSGIGAFVRIGAQVLPPPALADRSRERVPAVSQELLPSIFRGAALTDLPAPEEISRLQVPTQILAWVDDPSHPVATAEALHRLIPDSTLSIAATPQELATWPVRTAAHVAAHPAAGVEPDSGPGSTARAGLSAEGEKMVSADPR
ncbi:alpha/beta hydrolase [Nesterenkonia xinjiangensis]|uniref:Pimeloyl-ACP methyl ester carboxylesterase n=1 Tax=Nesterenkonia xinjiangensis TaxID=225327 RepID=A0A7Z0GN60_9MICC|nr:pimeloyl-ACP methyl ester carboxylesterase [Nesterenkonia xinjiangensis]